MKYNAWYNLISFLLLYFLFHVFNFFFFVFVLYTLFHHITNEYDTYYSLLLFFCSHLLFHFFFFIYLCPSVHYMRSRNVEQVVQTRQADLLKCKQKIKGIDCVYRNVECYIFDAWICVNFE